MLGDNYRHITAEQVREFGGDAYNSLFVFFQIHNFDPEDIVRFINLHELPYKKISAAPGSNVRAMLLLGKFQGKVANECNGYLPFAAWIPSMNGKDSIQWFLRIEDNMEVS